MSIPKYFSTITADTDSHPVGQRSVWSINGTVNFFFNLSFTF